MSTTWEAPRGDGCHPITPFLVALRAHCLGVCPARTLTEGPGVTLVQAQTVCRQHPSTVAVAFTSPVKRFLYFGGSSWYERWIHYSFLGLNFLSSPSGRSLLSMGVPQPTTTQVPHAPAGAEQQEDLPPRGAGAINRERPRAPLGEAARPRAHGQVLGTTGWPHIVPCAQKSTSRHPAKRKTSCSMLGAEKYLSEIYM